MGVGKDTDGNRRARRREYGRSAWEWKYDRWYG